MSPSSSPRAGHWICWVPRVAETIGQRGEKAIPGGEAPLGGDNRTIRPFTTGSISGGPFNINSPPRATPRGVALRSKQ